MFIEKAMAKSRHEPSKVPPWMVHWCMRNVLTNRREGDGKKRRAQEKQDKPDDSDSSEDSPSDGEDVSQTEEEPPEDSDTETIVADEVSICGLGGVRS